MELLRVVRQDWWGNFGPIRWMLAHGSLGGGGSSTVGIENQPVAPRQDLEWLRVVRQDNLGGQIGEMDQTEHFLSNTVGVSPRFSELVHIPDTTGCFVLKFRALMCLFEPHEHSRSLNFGSDTANNHELGMN